MFEPYGMGTIVLPRLASCDVVSMFVGLIATAADDIEEKKALVGGKIFLIFFMMCDFMNNSEIGGVSAQMKKRKGLIFKLLGNPRVCLITPKPHTRVRYEGMGPQTDSK